MKQQTLTGLEKYGKRTRRAKFLADMDRIIPWKELTAAVEQVYPKGGGDGGGRPPIALERSSKNESLAHDGPDRSVIFNSLLGHTGPAAPDPSGERRRMIAHQRGDEEYDLSFGSSP